MLELECICVVEGGQLVAVNRYTNHPFVDYTDVLSVLSYDGKNKATIMRKSGEIVSIDATEENIDFDMWASITYSTALQTCNYIPHIIGGVLFVYTLARTHMPIVVTSPIMMSIADATISSKYKNGLKIKFKNGDVEDYEIVGTTNGYSFVNETEHLPISHEGIYCQVGKMKEIGIKRIENGNTLDVTDINGEVYSFVRDYQFFGTETIKLLVAENYAMFVFDDRMLTTTKNRKFCQIDQEFKYYQYYYYVNDNGDVFKALDAYGKYEADPISRNFPLRSCVIWSVRFIEKKDNTIFIDKLPIISKIATEIENITIFSDFDIYSLIVKMKSGKSHKCALTNNACLVFEDGEIVKMIPETGDYYSSEGIFTNCPFSKINDRLLLINGNTVLFNNNSLIDPIIKVKESFGSYLGITNSRLVFIGKIIIHRTSTKVKPALRKNE